jgi:putative PEP-CTERM system histidine kinase
MTGSMFVTAAVWSYGSALAGYAAFAARAGFSSRRSSRAFVLLLALVATALWGAACLSLVAWPGTVATRVVAIAEVLRYAVWYLFLWHLIIWPNRAGLLRNAIVTIAVVVAANILLTPGIVIETTAVDPVLRPAFLFRLGLAVFGLMLVEQIVRRVQPQFRWAMKPMALALAAVFGLDLYFYADAMLYGHLDPDIWVARGFANAIVIPFLAVATVRNTGWTVDLHFSRRVVYHSSALLLSGLFLLLVAGAGYGVRIFGGDWGRALQIELLFGAVLFLALVAASGRFRSRLKVFISKHFFSYRYDYREEWLRFTGILSSGADSHSLPVRTLSALGNLLESPAGLLWLADETRGFVPAAHWNMPAVDVVERIDSSLVRFLEGTGWIVEVPQARADPAQYEDLVLPDWLTSLTSAWLIIPLAIGGKVLGFAVLMSPRTPVDVDWEVRDLLKTASRQAASYLGQAQATEALLEARKFDAFNRMSAFVVHDLKNLVAQLSLLLKNAQRHRDNPEFQADMLATIEHVVGRMNRLMLQLRTEGKPVDRPHHVDLEVIVQRACATKASATARVELETSSSVGVIGHEERLEHVIGHLIQNAIDAGVPGERVRVAIGVEGGFAVVTVSDRGVGMTPEFVRQRLFKPFQTTKQSGMGIGVYESAQYVSQLGGDIEIDSRAGEGTSVRVRLPRAEGPEIAPDTMAEHVA